MICFNLLPIPTSREFYELGNIFDREATVEWSFSYSSPQGTENGWYTSDGVVSPFIF
jgi:hypothetical protein